MISKKKSITTPRGWKNAKLGDLCEQRTELHQPDDSKKFTFIGLEHVNSGQTKLQFPRKTKKIKSTKFKFYANDLLYGKLRPYLDKAVISNFEGICSTDLIVLQSVSNKTFPTFLIYVIHSKRFVNYSIATTSGTNHPRTSWNALSKFLFPLPPLPEQKKIAEILTTVDQAIEKVDGAIQKAERLKKGLMQTLLTRGIGHKEFKETKIGCIPKEWKLTNIGSLGDLKYGYTSSSITEDTGIKFMRITDINENEKIEWEKVPFCNIKEKEYDKFSLNQGDVLFARIGATTGKTAFVDTIIKGVFASYLIKFNKTSKELDSKYFFFFTQSSQYWKQANKKREGQLKKGLNAKMISELKLPLPPLPEQKKIAEILSAADHKLELIRERKSKLERVKKGLMNDLLSGKRRVRL